LPEALMQVASLILNPTEEEIAEVRRQGPTRPDLRVV
jgi:hypothetical protein